MTNTVELLIRELIAAENGAIAFSLFVEQALYAPQLGYYMSPSACFGSEGDFVTAPGMSSLFAAGVAEQVASLLAILNCGSVIEVGGGDGALAHALIPRLQQRSTHFSDYRIVERSPGLRDLQRRRLATLPGTVELDWLERLPASGGCCVVLANELLDAIPCDRFEVHNRSIVPLGVGLEGDKLGWQRLAPDPEFEARVLAAIGDRWPDLEDGYRSEIAPLRTHWVAQWAKWSERGALLVFDYGYPAHEYYHPDRRDGTLQCHRRHRVHADPLVNIGQQDISAHVDFSALALVADCKVIGYTTQAGFLLASDIPQQLAALDPRSSTYLTLAGQLQRLVMPAQMGEAIKVMLLVAGTGEGWEEDTLLGNRGGRLRL